MKWMNQHATLLLSIALFALLALQTCRVIDEVSKRTPPASPEVSVPPGEPYGVTFDQDRTLVALDTERFADCAAFKVVFSGVYYGIFLPADVIYLPPIKKLEADPLEITCEGANEKDKYTTKYTLQN